MIEIAFVLVVVVAGAIWWMLLRVSPPGPEERHPFAWPKRHPRYPDEVVVQRQAGPVVSLRLNGGPEDGKVLTQYGEQIQRQIAPGAWLGGGIEPGFYHAEEDIHVDAGELFVDYTWIPRPARDLDLGVS